MFVPIHDENTLRRIKAPYVTYGLIALNVLVLVFQSAGLSEPTIASFGVIPVELFMRAGLISGGVDAVLQTVPVPEQLTLISYMFFHGDWLHLAGNMLFLWVFGDNVEDAMGHVKFLLFYLLCGVFAALTHAAVVPDSANPLIGASGAVAGVISAYLMLHPRVRVWVIAFKFIPLRITAAVALGLWILIQLLMVMLPQMEPIAWWAHIGGLVAGAVLIVVLRDRGVPLFDKGLDLTA
ncbi:MAG: rhomboid family intramembrane serine protease [Hyphomicrobium sp.]|nr:rhomboid family intramembrane serine protease [Hyphomicrobium sp.]